MIIRHLDSLRETEHAVDFGSGISVRFLTKRDGMGFTMTDTYLEAGSNITLRYDHHIESCYILDGEGELHHDGGVEQLRPGLMFAANEHDEHTVKALTQIRMICVFSPALTGFETHDFSRGKASGYGPS